MPTQGPCDSDEFGMARAKPKPDAEPTPATPQLPPADQSTRGQARLPVPVLPPHGWQRSPTRKSCSACSATTTGNRIAPSFRNCFSRARTAKPPRKCLSGPKPECYGRMSIDYQGAPHKLAVLVSRPLGPQDLPENCNDCKPIIGAALLGQGADGWKAEGC